MLVLIIIADVYGRTFDILTGLSAASIIPGVMGDTGMETADIIKGIAKQIKPSVIIVIDALAARDIERLNTTIQLSDRGINPGSGVGNHRVGINYENIGIPVLAIGVPTVIDALTIVTDLVNPLISDCSADEIAAFFSGIDNNMKDMYVTPKAIDQDIKNISSIISSAINNLGHAGIS
jgi:spore protease